MILNRVFFIYFQLQQISLNDSLRLQENGDVMPGPGAMNRPVELSSKPLLLQDLEAAMLLSAGNVHQAQQLQNNLTLESQPQRFEPMQDMILHHPSSLPLYRRQSAQKSEPTAHSINNRNLIVNSEDVNVEQFLNNFNVIHLNSKVWEADKIQPELKVINRDMYINNMQELDHNINKGAMQISNNKINGNEIQGFANFQRTMFQPPPRHMPLAPQVSTVPSDNPFINDFHLNGREQDIDESVANRQNNIETTYASVLRAQPAKNQNSEEEKVGDPFGILKDLANSSTSRGNNGLYQYFS